MCPKNVEEAGQSFRILQATKTNDDHVYFLVYHPGYGQFIQKLESVEFNIQVPKYLPKITTDYPKKFENSFLDSDSEESLVSRLKKAETSSEQDTRKEIANLQKTVTRYWYLY